jgi:CRP-like cAMP-binding protein
MFQLSPQTELFKQQLSNSLNQEIQNTRSIKFAKNSNIYTCGDKSEYVYYIVSGQIKLVTVSSIGKECLLSIYAQGDIFGELCLTGFSERQETATAMCETLIKQLPCSRFFSRLTEDSLHEGFIKYLSMRISDQQAAITSLVTVDSEQRLGRTLLNLAHKLGKKTPLSVKIDHWISHEELSEMVGTTRPRITKFINKFRELDLIEINPRHFISVKEKKLAAYLEKIV